MRAILVCLALSIGFSTHAETIFADYSSFYSHVNKIDDEETNMLQFAFGFQHINENRLCVIQSAAITTQKQTIDLPITPEYRFSVPSDKVLKLAKAKVKIEFSDQANLCDISVQLETKPEYLKTDYSQLELADLFAQYTIFFDDIGGFLSFLMPDATGLTFHFSESIADQKQRYNFASITEQRLTVDQRWLSKNDGVKFDTPPFRITAVTSK